MALVDSPRLSARKRVCFRCGSRLALCLQTLYLASALNIQKSMPDSSAAAGSVKIHAAAMLRIVVRCNPLRLATIVPATLELSTGVVDTGRPYVPAARIVAIVT